MISPMKRALFPTFAIACLAGATIACRIGTPTAAPGTEAATDTAVLATELPDTTYAAASPPADIATPTPLPSATSAPRPTLVPSTSTPSPEPAAPTIVQASPPVPGEALFAAIADEAAVTLGWEENVDSGSFSDTQAYAEVIHHPPSPGPCPDPEGSDIYFDNIYVQNLEPLSSGAQGQSVLETVPFHGLDGTLEVMDQPPEWYTEIFRWQVGDGIWFQAESWSYCPALLDADDIDVMPLAEALYTAAARHGLGAPEDDGLQPAEAVATSEGEDHLTMDLPCTLAPAQNVTLVGHIGGTVGTLLIEGSYAYAGIGPELAILNVANPAAPARIGYLVLPDLVRDVTVVDSHAYVADDEAGLWVVDISDPSAPTQLGSYDTPGRAQAVVVVGPRAYVADDTSLRIMDISDPTTPAEIGFLDTLGHAASVAVRGGYAYVGQVRCAGEACSGTLQVVDVSNPAAPAAVATYDMPGYTVDVGVTVVDAKAYVADGLGGLRIIDVSDPTAPAAVGAWPREPGEVQTANGVYAANVAVTGDHAYIADQLGGMSVVDVSDPSNPEQVGTYTMPGGAADVAIAGSFAYVAGRQGLQIVDLSDTAAPVPAGSYQVPSWPNRVEVEGDLAYVASGRGLRIVDVSIPADPVQVGSYDPPREIQNLTTLDGYALVTDGDCAGVQCGGHLLLVDTTDPAFAIPAGSLDLSPGFAVAASTQGSYAYLAARQDGLRVVDLSSPDTPREVSALHIPGFAMDVTVHGNHAFVAARGGGLRVIDISDPTTPREVGFHLPPDETWTVAVSGRLAYVGDRTFGLRVVDISDPTAPFEIGALDMPLGASCQDVVVAGDLVYLATGFKGLHVIDVSDPYVPLEVGFYQSPGTADSVAWVDGLIYVADGQGGLLILRRS